MELHSLHKPFHHIHLGEERHQMLNLNQRLESYLGRVKLLEEENVQLHREIQALRHSNQGTPSLRKALEKELRQARMEVDTVWRERDRTEMEVGILAEELQALGLQRQREVEATMEAKAKLNESRKEMEEERRVQIWLREKVNQLEKEIQFQTETHQENVAHMEATLAHSRPTVPPTLARMSNQMPNLVQLGQEYTQRASRAWQEATEAYQGQVVRLEESLNQTSSHLNQLAQEKSESQLKLQALQKEISSAQEVRVHLEKTAAQQRDRHSLEIQQLQELLQGLEVQRDELGQQIDRLVLDNRSLVQLKMSLGLEVATYRALLDNESLRGDISSVNQPRKIYITDAFSSPRGVKENYQTQLSISRKTAPLSSILSVKGRSKPAVITTPSIWTRRPATLSETPLNPWKTGENQTDEDIAKTTKSATGSTPYPKVLQNGAVEHFRPQEVHEEVTYAEPLSPPNELEPPAESLVASSHKEMTAEDKEGKEDWGILDARPPEEPLVVESALSYQVESVLSSKPPFNNEVRRNQHTTGNLTPYHVLMAEESLGVSDESDENVPSEVPAEKQDMPEPRTPVEAWVEREFITMGKEAEHVQEESSDSETEAVLEPTPGSSTDSPVSEHEPDESMINQLSEVSQEENILNDDAGPVSQQTGGSMVRAIDREFEDKLYPDGEDMDTWDSVMERKADMKEDNGRKNDQTETQHAEPEEDISAREPEREVKEIKEESASIVQHDNNMAFSLVDTKLDDNREHAVSDQEHAQLPGEGEDNDEEEEDSQNVSVSWRTELESDSYAQDNTLADTRPLIRYKSDETDANTQASHMDESESSDGEDDKKVGGTGTGTWSENKSKRSGTMEDLCEEAEGEVLDEEYDLGYTHIEDRDVGHDVARSEHATLENDEKSEVEMIEKVTEGNSEKETELTKPVEPTVLLDVDDNDELERVDRLVELELESLSTFTYSAHFAQQQADEREAVLNQQAMSAEELSEQEEAGTTRIREGTLSCAEPEVAVHHKLTSSYTDSDQPHEHPYVSDTSVAMPHAEDLAEEEVQQKEQETVDAAEKKEGEDEHNLSMVTHVDMTDDHSVCSDLNSRPESQITMNNSDIEESNISEDESPNASLCSAVHLAADMENLLDVAERDMVTEAVEESNAALQHTMEEVTECQAFPEVPETTEWEVLDDPKEDLESRGQNEDGQTWDNTPQSTQSFHDEGSTHQGAVTKREESPEISPESIPAEEDIFLVKDSTEPLNTNGKDKGLHGFFTSGVSSDLWASSLDTGATYLPDDSYNEASEKSNQNLGFGDSLVWGNLENSNAANGNSRMATDSLVGKEEEEQRPSEVKQFLHQKINEGDSVHSEDSENEGESWSSGEE